MGKGISSHILKVKYDFELIQKKTISEVICSKKIVKNGFSMYIKFSNTYASLVLH